MYNILSIDGGGTHGIVAARIIQRLEIACPGFLDSIDLFAGTSTGGLAALTFAMGMDAGDVVEFYRKYSKKIFHKSLWRKISFNLFNAKYSNNGLRETMVEIFGQKKLTDLSRKVLISSFALNSDEAGYSSYRPKFFTNLEGGANDAYVADVGIYTASAPTYFPTYGGYVDGGVCCNDPSVAAIAQSLDPKTQPVCRLEEIQVMSLGTGLYNTSIHGNHDWGILGWGIKLVDMLLVSHKYIADYQSNLLLGNRYHRIDPILDKDYDIDDVSALQRMVECADRYNIDKHILWIKTNLKRV